MTLSEYREWNGRQRNKNDKENNTRRNKDTRLYACRVYILDWFSCFIHVWRMLVR